MHPAPRRVAVVGPGSGDTVFGAGGRPETGVIDCIEIASTELAALRTLDAARDCPGLRRLLRDARVRIHIADGRAFLRHTPVAYDIIEADALRPTSAYAGNLYSVEYFELLRTRLAPGGLAVTWMPTERVRDTFIRVFPYVLVFADIAVGSVAPIPFDRARLAEMTRVSSVRDYYRAGGLDLPAVLSRYVTGTPLAFGPEFDRSALLDVNRDLFPKDEFGLPYRRDR